MKNSKKELVFDIQELDRKRIARDLHDTSLQNLAHLVHKLELASMYMDKDVVRAKLEIAYISKSINSIIKEIRNTIFDLRPMLFDDLGLKESMERVLDKIKESSDMVILYHIEDVALEDETVALGLFRIFQECITNACKHSKGKYLKILLTNKPDHIELSVQDDGVGFDIDDAKKKERHFGLLIMEERVEAISGKLEIISAINQGTKINVIIPKSDENMI